MARTILLMAAAACMGTSCDNMKKIKPQAYPQTEREAVSDNYFGTEVPDPYRWLEDDNSERTAAWVKAQNAVTEDYLSQIECRTAIHRRLTQLWNYAKESAPVKHGDKWYYSYNDGLKNQSVIYQTDAPGKSGRVFLDPNTLSEDGTVALITHSFSHDGRYMSYAEAKSGSDWVEIKVIDTQTGERLDDVIRWVKFSGASWDAESKGFYYSAYDAPKSGVYSSQNRHQKIYHHLLGQRQEQDRLVYADPAHPLRYFSAWASEDGKWEFVLASEGTSGGEVLFRRRDTRDFRVLLRGFEHDYLPVECRNDRLYYVTNRDASNYALRVVDLNHPQDDRVLIAEQPRSLLQNVTLAGGSLFAEYLEDAQAKIYQYDFDGRLIREVEMPGIGSAVIDPTRDEEKETYYTLTGFTTPSTIYKYDVESGRSTLYKTTDVRFNADDMITEQVFYTSKDGTKVPMFITRRKDVRLDGNNPCLLYAYGGFQISLTPAFKPAAIMFVEQGGIYCEANLRGGLEYGEAWHKAGMLENKQNVFDDFIAAAEYLIAEKYTSPSKLAIHGGSNGGLLVGACEVQRPDLYAVCLPAVGVLDMLRYHRFTIGWGWAVEYGTSEDAGQFAYIYKYSPLHNVKEGVEYPATLVMTGDHDDRVVPAHSFKYAATLQHAQKGDAPVLIRIESNAGHGAGKPTSKRIDEAADMYAFLFQNTETRFRPLE